MADVELDDPWNRGDRTDGLERKAVPGMAFEAKIFSHYRRRRKTGQLGLARPPSRLAVSTGMKLNYGRADLTRRC